LREVSLGWFVVKPGSLASVQTESFCSFLKVIYRRTLTQHVGLIAFFWDHRIFLQIPKYEFYSTARIWFKALTLNLVEACGCTELLNFKVPRNVTCKILTAVSLLKIASTL